MPWNRLNDASKNTGSNIKKNVESSIGRYKTIPINHLLNKFNKDYPKVHQVLVFGLKVSDTMELQCDFSRN